MKMYLVGYFWGSGIFVCIVNFRRRLVVEEFR